MNNTPIAVGRWVRLASTAKREEGIAIEARGEVRGYCPGTGLYIVRWPGKKIREHPAADLEVCEC